MNKETVGRLEEELKNLKASYGALSPEWTAGHDRLLEDMNDMAAAQGRLYIRRLELRVQVLAKPPGDPLV